MAVTELARPSGSLAVSKGSLAASESEQARGARPTDRLLIVAALGVLVVVTAWAVAPALFVTHDPYTGVVDDRFAAPSFAHLLGTDNLGRDIYSRVVAGTRESVLTAFLAIAVALLFGGLAGLVAGLFGGAVDAVIGRVVDILLSMPSFLLAVILLSALGFSSFNAALAVGIASSGVFARLTRSEVLRVKTTSFVEYARLIGNRPGRLLVLHILPNTYPSVVSLALLNVGSAILSISGLAFLGYGNPPPSADWGLLIAEGRSYLYQYPWCVVAPGAVIVVTVLAINIASRRFIRGLASD